MNKKDKSGLTDLYITYRNYLYALQEREEFGDKYGDTKEIIEIYEKELEEHNIKKLTKAKK